MEFGTKEAAQGVYDDAMRRAALLLLLSLVLGACADKWPTSASGTRPKNQTTPCHDVIPDCKVARLPDKILTGSETDGALQSADGFDLGGIISFDDALKLGWHDSARTDAKSVQVVLGSADADRLHWGTGSNLYYAIEWNGVCGIMVGGVFGDSSPPSPNCDGRLASVFDAHTGAFIVEGT